MGQIKHMCKLHPASSLQAIGLASRPLATTQPILPGTCWRPKSLTLRVCWWAQKRLPLVLRTHPLLQVLLGPPWGCSSHFPLLLRLQAGSQLHPLPLLGPRPSAPQQGSPPLAGAHSASPSPRWVTALRSLSPGPWMGTWRSPQGPLACHCFPPGGACASSQASPPSVPWCWALGAPPCHAAPPAPLRPFGPPPALQQSCWCPRGRWRAWRAAGRWEAGWGCVGLGGCWALGKELSWSLEARVKT